MNDHLVEKVWRVRMKYSPEEKDYSSTAWKHGEVGIWYGAWSVEDFEEARNRKEGSIEDHLNRLPRRHFSGKFNLRISPDLHEKLAIAAQAQGKSINTLAQEALRDCVAS